MKKLTSLLFSLILVFALATGVHAQQASQVVDKPVTVSINGEQVEFDNQQPFVEKGTTLVPARTILEALDYNVTWDQENNIVVAEKYGLQIALQVDNDTALVNGVEVPLTAAPKVQNGTTYVPLRFISEAIGFTVDWHGPTQAVALTKLPSKGYTWKIEKDGNTAYLTGSMHVGDTKMYPLRDEIEQAFDSSDKLAVEVIISQGFDEETKKALQAIVTYSDGTTLKDHISADTYALVQRFLTEIGAEATLYDIYKPWFVVNDINTVLSQLQGYQGGLGIDLYFENRAQQANKPIVELETAVLQYNAFDSYSKEFQEQQLSQLLNAIYGINQDNQEVSESALTVVDLANLWISGDDEGLETFTVLYAKESPEEYEKLIKNRHAGMLEKIEGYLNNENKETYFIIAGYLHMLGEDGLVTQLKEKGYTVTRI